MRCEHLFGTAPGRDDLLVVSVLDERLDGRTVRCKAKGQRVAIANHLLGLQDVTIIGRGRSHVGEAPQTAIAIRKINYLTHLTEQELIAP